MERGDVAKIPEIAEAEMPVIAECGNARKRQYYGECLKRKCLTLLL